MKWPNFLKRQVLCPYCLGTVHPLPRGKCPKCDRQIPEEYVRDYARFPPEVVQYIAFRGHGKTTAVASLFHTLKEPILNDKWGGYFSKPLTRGTRKYFKKSREMMTSGRLPNPQQMRKPLPAIVKLNDIPDGYNCTLLSYDAAGEAFKDPKRMNQFAPFVGRARTAVFLISIPHLATRGDEIPQMMEELLQTYLDGMALLHADTKKQRLIVTYTMADELEASLTGAWEDIGVEVLKKGSLQNFVERNDYMDSVQQLSRRLLQFTWFKLQARQFVNLADDSFSSVDFSMMSALGKGLAIPETTTKNGPNPRKPYFDGPIEPKRILDHLLMVIDRRYRPFNVRLRDLAESLIERPWDVDAAFDVADLNLA